MSTSPTSAIPAPTTAVPASIPAGQLLQDVAPDIADREPMMRGAGHGR
ncbi:hypothetical protein [Streptomyces anandii]|nr:hypothetical protein [Streptomyces anandii]